MAYTPPVIEKEHTCAAYDEVMADDDNWGEVYGMYGAAIVRPVKVGVYWFAQNGEYSIAIRFCPFCGEKLE